MQEVIEGLTRPLDDTDLAGASFERTTPRLGRTRQREKLRPLFEENRWTDFMPIVLPTEERVAAMLKGTSHAPDKVVRRMRAGNFRETWEYKVEKVAVNAVMAGARLDEIVSMYEPKEINVVVVGGGTQSAWKIYGANHVKTASVDEWR